LQFEKSEIGPNQAKNQKVLEEDLDKSPDKKPAMNKLIERATIK
jgi:hypothetical protein